MKPFRLFHFDIKTLGNYGDTLLFEAVRQTFHAFGDRSAFKFTGSCNLRDVVGPKLVSAINNNYDAVVIGGGGLFLTDTNPNQKSGWQWNCSIDLLSQIEKPIIVFAVGNNRFPGQADFSSRFKEHVNLLVEKAAFFGLRNSGSVETIRSYLPKHLQEKVVFQPCPTTIGAHLYPDLYVKDVIPEKRLSIQALVGKRQVAAGFDRDSIYAECSTALEKLRQKGWDISTFSNARGDNQFADTMAETIGPLDHHKLFGSKNIFSPLDFFASLPLTVGMRGHAQMIPFGMGNPILSLFVHNKLRYFLEDIGHPELCIDVRRPGFGDEIVETSEYVFNNFDALRSDFKKKQKEFFSLTKDNLSTIYQRLGGGRPAAKFSPYSDFERHLAQQSYVYKLELEQKAEVAPVRDEAA